MPHKRAKRSERAKNGTQIDQAPGTGRTKNALSSEDIPKGAMRVFNAAKVQEEYRKRKMQGEGPRPEGSAKKRRKTTTGEDSGKGTGKDNKGIAMKIQPGESLAHFNRRVEENMRPLVRDAMHTSAAVTRRTKKEEEVFREAEKAAKAKSTPKSKKQPSNGEKSANTDDEDEAGSPAPGPSSSKAPPKSAQPKEKATEFVGLKTSAPRRLNDIVQAPPELKKLPRGAKSLKAAKADGAAGTKTLREGIMSMAQKAMLEQERERAIMAYRDMKKRGVGQ